MGPAELSEDVVNEGVVAVGEEQAWTGSGIEPYEVGDPGRAAREVAATLPAAPSDPADTQIDAGGAGPLEVRAASVRGVSHRHSATPRQDDYALAATGDWLIVVVADGVSSGPLSHQAATLACRAATAQVQEALEAGAEPDAIPWGDVLGAASRRIVAHGLRSLPAAEGIELDAAEVARAMSTTLVIAVVSTAAGEDGAHAGVVHSFGDCSVFRLGADGWAAVTDVKNEGAQMATSATVALPYVPEEVPPATPLALGAGEALFVMTDGVGDPLGSGDGDVGSFLATVWGGPPDPVTFAAQIGFARKSFDDDRTVVGIWAQA